MFKWYRQWKEERACRKWIKSVKKWMQAECELWYKIGFNTEEITEYIEKVLLTTNCDPRNKDVLTLFRNLPNIVESYHPIRPKKFLAI